MSGEHIGSHAPYGYMKNPDNKKEWIVDEEAAEVVREIFRLCVNGYGPTRCESSKADAPSSYKNGRNAYVLRSALLCGLWKQNDIS